MTIQLHCLIPPKWVISCSLTFAFETFDNWWKHWVKRYQLILLIIEIWPHQLRLVSCPTIILWTQPTRLITVSRIWPSTIINMYHLTHSSAPTNSSYFTSSHPQQSQPTSHQTSLKKKMFRQKKAVPHGFWWWETSLFQLPLAGYQTEWPKTSISWKKLRI